MPTLLGSAKEKSGVQKQSYAAEQERISKLLGEAAKSAPEAVQPYAVKIAPAVAHVVVMGQKAAPYCMKAYNSIAEVLSALDEDLWYAIGGVLMCFFGGMYPLIIAAYEAFQLTGGVSMMTSVKGLVDEAKVVFKANKDDNKKDDDGNGVADVDQLSGQELLLRKTKLFLVNADPEKINDALTGLYTGWVGVLASLKIEFAKTIALGAAIGTMIQKPADGIIMPIVKRAMPEEYQKWVPQIINYTCKAVAISIAWTVQRVISAVHSAIRGGLICSRGLMRYAYKTKMIPVNEDESYVDEISGWALAFVGFLFQFNLGFSMPAILSYTVFLPLNLLESYLMWVVQS